MTPTIKKLKDSRGRTIGYSARIGDLQEVEGKTATETKAACLAMLDAYLRDHQRGPLTLRLFDRAMYLEPCRYTAGFIYRLEGSDCVHGPYDTRETAKDRAAFHCAQNAWSLDTDDAAFFAAIPPQVAKELAPWVRWQRAYAAARATGLNDHEARATI